MYLVKPHDKQWVCDIETDSLKPTVVWLCCCRNAVTGEEVTLTTYEEMRDWFEKRIAEGCVFVFHNGIKFDAPVLNTLVGTRIPFSRIIDTFLMSMLFSPSMPGGHSLEAWGERLKYPKDEFSNWEGGLTPEMIKYCVQDVRLGTLVFTRLVQRMMSVGFTERGCEIEHFAWEIGRQQQRNGFHFNQEEAVVLYSKLQGILDDLRKQIYEYWPPELKPIRIFKRALRKDGSPSKLYEDHLEQYPRVELHDDGTYTVFDWIEFNLASPPQRTEKLLALGWKPLEFTKKTAKGGGGNPQPTIKGRLAPSLEAFVEESGKKEVRLLANWLALNGVSNMISTWMDAYNDKTGCIHGNLWLASSLRYRHDNPNTANIPGVKHDKEDNILYGLEGNFAYEARALWDTRDKERRRLVGVDAKGIQLRVLAHYLNNPLFTEAILSSDPHTANMKAFGFTSRSLTKTITYAILMGAGDGRIAKEAKVSLSEAKDAKAMFFDRIPELKDLIDRLEGQFEKTGRIILCDGTPILLPQSRMGIPYLLQGDESRIMKQGKIYAARTIRRERLDVLFCGDVHDEIQADVALSDVERYIRVCEESFAESGRSFSYNLPIECSSAVGLHWGQTH